MRIEIIGLSAAARGQTTSQRWPFPCARRLGSRYHGHRKLPPSRNAVRRDCYRSSIFVRAAPPWPRARARAIGFSGWSPVGSKPPGAWARWPARHVPIRTTDPGRRARLGSALTQPGSRPVPGRSGGLLGSTLLPRRAGPAPGAPVPARVGRRQNEGPTPTRSDNAERLPRNCRAQPKDRHDRHDIARRRARAVEHPRSTERRRRSRLVAARFDRSAREATTVADLDSMRSHNRPAPRRTGPECGGNCQGFRGHAVGASRRPQRVD